MPDQYMQQHMQHYAHPPPQQPPPEPEKPDVFSGLTSLKANLPAAAPTASTASANTGGWARWAGGGGPQQPPYGAPHMTPGMTPYGAPHPQFYQAAPYQGFMSPQGAPYQQPGLYPNGGPPQQMAQQQQGVHPQQYPANGMVPQPMLGMPGAPGMQVCQKRNSVRINGIHTGTGTANALENHETTYALTCLGHVRVSYILTNRNDMGKYDV